MNFQTLRALLGIALMLLGCARAASEASTQPRATADEIAVARLAWFTITENQITAAAIAEPHSRAFAAMSAVGKPILTPSHIHPSHEDLLPAGYWRIDTVLVLGDSARFVAWQGPIPKPKPGVQLGCGTGHKLWLFRQPDGSWAIGPTRAVTLC